MTHTLPLPDLTHERVEVMTGPRSGLVITVALHSSALGSALGGARLWTYPHWSDALGDALRLSAAMTLKNAAAGLDAGGDGVGEDVPSRRNQPHPLPRREDQNIEQDAVEHPQRVDAEVQPDAAHGEAYQQGEQRRRGAAVRVARGHAG